MTLRSHLDRRAAELAHSRPQEKPEYLRDASVVANGTELYHRGTSHCDLVVVWNPELTGTSGIDIAQDVAVIAQYVRETIDNPLTYASPRQVEEANADLVAAEDGTELRSDFDRTCTYREMSATYNVYPPVARLGAQKPATVIDEYWKKLPNKDVIVTGLRAGVVSALLQRRVKLIEGQLEEIADAVRQPVDIENRGSQPYGIQVCGPRDTPGIGR